VTLALRVEHAFLRDVDITDPSTTNFRVFLDGQGIGPDTPVLSKANLTREQLHCAMQRAIERATGRPHPRSDILEAS